MVARVNISIWKGTTMENTNRKYTSFVKMFSTRVIYQAHMEQNSKIAATEVTVIRMLVKKAAAKPLEPRASI